MISPFPEEKPILNRDEPETDVVSIVSTLFPSLINQARFKPDALFLAADPEHASRYLIGNRVATTKSNRSRDMASPAGSSAVSAASFRVRCATTTISSVAATARSSCASHFAVPEDNEVIASWMTLPNTEKEKYRANPTGRAKRCISFVPIGDWAQEVPRPGVASD